MPPFSPLLPGANVPPSSQALRIHLNDEFGEFVGGIHGAFDLLAPGGRIGVITWKHSECALLIDEFRKCARANHTPHAPPAARGRPWRPRRLEAARDESPSLAWLSAQPGAPSLPTEWSARMVATVRPSQRELQTNSRARSAVLHVLEKARAIVAASVRNVYDRVRNVGWD